MWGCLILAKNAKNTKIDYCNYFTFYYFSTFPFQVVNSTNSIHHHVCLERHSLPGSQGVGGFLEQAC